MFATIPPLSAFKSIDELLKDITRMSELFTVGFGEQYSSPKIQDFFMQACLVISLQPSGGLFEDLIHLIEDESFRLKKLESISETDFPELIRFWLTQKNSDLQSIVPVFEKRIHLFPQLVWQEFHKQFVDEVNAVIHSVDKSDEQKVKEITSLTGPSAMDFLKTVNIMPLWFRDDSLSF